MSETGVAELLAEVVALREMVAREVSALTARLERLNARIDDLTVRAVSGGFVPETRRLFDRN